MPPKRKATKKTPHDFGTDADFLSFRSALVELEDSQGFLHATTLTQAGEQIGKYVFTLEQFQKCDHKRSGKLHLTEVAKVLFPMGKDKDLHRHFTTVLTESEVIGLKKAFDKLSVVVDGVKIITEQLLTKGGETLDDIKISISSFRDFSESQPITFPVLVAGVFPKIPSALLKCYVQTELLVDEFWELKQRFDALDTDKSGQLTLDELTNMKSWAGIQFNHHFFATIDKDKSGQLSFVEFLKGLFPLIPLWDLQYVIKTWGSQPPPPQQSLAATDDSISGWSGNSLTLDAHVHRRESTISISNQTTTTPSVASSRSIAKPQRKRPKRTAVELSEEEFLYLQDVFQELDSDGSGALSLKEIEGKKIAGVVFDTQMFKKLDKDRSGYVSIVEIILLIFPKLNPRDVTRMFQTDLTNEVLGLLKKGFLDISVKAILDYKKLQDHGERLLGMRLSVQQLKHVYHGKDISFKDVLKLLYPSIPAEIIDRYVTAEIPQEDFNRLKKGFEMMDKDGGGTISLREFNRSTQNSSSSASDWIRLAGSGAGHTTIGGMKFDASIFNRIDKDRSGTITFIELLKAFYPSVSEMKIRKMIKAYNAAHSPESLRGANDTSHVIKEEHDCRQTLYRDQNIARIKLEQNARGAWILLRERSLLHWRDRQARDRRSVELKEDSDREAIVIDEEDAREALEDGFQRELHRISTTERAGGQHIDDIIVTDNDVYETVDQLIAAETKRRANLMFKQKVKWDYLLTEVFWQSYRSHRLNKLMTEETTERYQISESNWYTFKAFNWLSLLHIKELKDRKQVELRQQQEWLHLMTTTLNIMDNSGLGGGKPTGKKKKQSYLHALLEEQGEELCNIGYENSNIGVITHNISKPDKIITAQQVIQIKRIKPNKTVQRLKTPPTIGNTDVGIGGAINGTIQCVVYSPDAHRILTSNGNIIQEWEADTGTLVQQYIDHIHTVTAVAYNKDGSQFVSADCNGTIKEWIVIAGSVKRTLHGHKARVVSVAYSADNSKLLSCDVTGLIKEWSADTGGVIQTFCSTVEQAVHHANSNSNSKIHHKHNNTTTTGYTHNSPPPCNNNHKNRESVNDVHVVSAGYSADETKIISAHADGTVQDWEVNPGSYGSSVRVESVAGCLGDFQMPNNINSHALLFNFCRFCDEAARHTHRAHQLIHSLLPYFPQFKFQVQVNVPGQTEQVPYPHKAYSPFQQAKCCHFFVYMVPHGYADTCLNLIGPEDLENCTRDKLVQKVSDKIRDFPLPNLLISVVRYQEAATSTHRQQQQQPRSADGSGIFGQFTHPSAASTPPRGGPGGGSSRGSSRGNNGPPDGTKWSHIADRRHVRPMVSLGNQEHRLPESTMRDATVPINVKWDIQNSTVAVYVDNVLNADLHVALWCRCGATETELGECLVPLKDLLIGIVQPIKVNFHAFGTPTTETAELTLLLKPIRAPFQLPVLNRNLTRSGGSSGLGYIPKPPSSSRQPPATLPTNIHSTTSSSPPISGTQFRTYSGLSNVNQIKDTNTSKPQMSSMGTHLPIVTQKTAVGGTAAGTHLLTKPPTNRPLGTLPIKELHWNTTSWNDNTLKEIFNELDVSKKGWIRKQDFTTLYHSFDDMGISHSHDKINKIIESHNMLGDDVLSYDEFCVLMWKVAQR